MTLNDDSSKHNKSAANLRFKKSVAISGTAEATPSDSRDRKNIAFQDPHVDMVNKADEIQTKVQDVNFRVQAKNDVSAKTKFSNFSTSQQFTSSGKGRNPAHHTEDGGQL